ncbi:hypothetical protein B5D77_03705 [Microcystis sp. MC19]|nr:hypothetical protein B5D77_03705 [Microcystis sp. MC19]
MSSQKHNSILDQLFLHSQKVKYLIRENTGFNIGAWDYGWRHFPPYDYYLGLAEKVFPGGRVWPPQPPLINYPLVRSFLTKREET